MLGTNKFGNNLSIHKRRGKDCATLPDTKLFQNSFKYLNIEPIVLLTQNLVTKLMELMKFHSETTRGIATENVVVAAWYIC